MKTYQGNLLLLLRLMEDSLSPAERARAQKLLAAPDCQSRWQLLKETGRRNPLSITNASELESELASVPADRIAAYLEQQLPAAEAEELEAACWQSPSILSELISTYRFLQKNKPQAVAGSLTNRLLQLAPAATADPDGEQLVDRAERPVTPEDPANGQRVDWQSRLPSVAAAEPVGETGGQTWRPRRSRRRMLFAWSYAVALAFVVACVAGIIFLVNRNDEDPTAIPKPDQKEQSPREDGSLPEERFATDGDSKRPLPPQDQKKERTGEEGKNDPNFDNDWREQLGLPEDWQPPDDWFDPDVEEDPEFELQPNLPNRLPVKFSWDRVEGLVAGFDESDRTWHGIHYGEQIGKIDRRFATFPESWAQTWIEQLGRMVLAADTQFRVERQTANPLEFEISLERGRLALHDLPVEREVTVRIGKLRWRIRTARPKSVVAVDFTSASPRIFVTQGEALVDGQAVGTRKQISWADRAWTDANSLNRRENTNWTERPVGIARLSSKVQQRLLRSADLVADLETVEGLDDRLATRWSLAIAPQNTFARMSSPDADVRVEAFRWLLSLHPRDRRFTMAMRQFVAKANNPQLVRAIATLIQQTRLGRLPDATVTQQTLRGLRHPELAVRHFAAYVLEATFGTKTKFQADARGHVRDAQAALMTREIQQFYRALRQRSGQAPGAAGQNNRARAAQPQRANRPNAANPQRRAVQPNRDR